MATSASELELSLPSIYRPLALTPPSDPFDEACALATAQGEPGTFLWARREDWAQCAVLLAPDQRAASALLVAYVALLGLREALGAVAPPAVPATFGWPDRLLVNGALAGGIRVRLPPVKYPDDVPDWLAVGIEVLIVGDPEDSAPGRHVDRTSLYEEGCGEVTAIALLESFGRYFLNWINRWQDDGFAPVKAAWLARAEDHEEEIEFSLDGRRHAGRFAGIDDSGDLVLVRAGERSRLDLARALSALG
jgi:biotin-(acetyl-CoA carboxylase) ligase